MLISASALALHALLGSPPPLSAGTAAPCALQDGVAQEASASAAAAAPASLDRAQAMQEGVALLLRRQENLSADEGAGKTHEGEACEWPYEGVYRVRRNGRSVIPIGYRIGGTSIASWALLEAPGWEADTARQAAVHRALGFVLEGLRSPDMSPNFVSGYDVRGWGHVYALRLLLRLRQLERVPAEYEAAVGEAAAQLVSTLQNSEIEGAGGWNYSRRRTPSPSTFMTAPAVQSLLAAREAGLEVDEAVLQRALDSLEEGRLDSGAFQYATSRRKTGSGFEAVEGAIGRMAICETTLLQVGRGSVERVRGSIDAFFQHWQHLEDRRSKNGTHEPPFMIAPYYFYFAHTAAAEAIELLPPEERAPLRLRLDRQLEKVREPSGGWNDRVFERSEAFGTAMVILAWCAPATPAEPLPAAAEQDRQR